MPYIKRDERSNFDDYLVSINPQNCGQLNYCITKLCISYLHNKGIKYQTYNDIVGVLECAKLEIYRRKVQFYEDEKIQENSDVY